VTDPGELGGPEESFSGKKILARRENLFAPGGLVESCEAGDNRWVACRP